MGRVIKKKGNNKKRGKEQVSGKAKTESNATQNSSEIQNDETHNNKLKIEIIGLYVGVIAALLAIFVSIKDDFAFGSFDRPFLKENDCVPYYLTGLAFIPASEKIYGFDDETDIGFAVRGFAENPKKNPVRIDFEGIDILNVEPIRSENVCVGCSPIVSEGNIIKVYALNDGLAESSEHSSKVTFYKIFSEQHNFEIDTENEFPISDIAEELFCTSRFSLEPCELLQIMEYKLDPIRFQELGVDYVALCVYDGEAALMSEFWYLTYDETNDTFFFEGAGGNEYYDADVSAILDVENVSIDYYNYIEGPVQYIDEEKTRCISVAIFPTESCRLRCKCSFSIDGKMFQTDIKEVTIIVPVFDDLLYLLSEIDFSGDVGPRKYQEILRNHAYNPEDILMFNQRNPDSP